VKHRKMLFLSIGLIIIGVILWLVIGPALLYAGIGLYTSGWWIFSETYYYLTTLGWVGYGLTVTGLVILIIGIGLLVIAAILEITDRKKTETTSIKTNC